MRAALLLAAATCGCAGVTSEAEPDATVASTPPASVQQPGPCSPTKTGLDGDVSAAVQLDMIAGTCGVSRVSWLESLDDHALLFVRDRAFCTRGQCFGFDALHVISGWHFVLPSGELGFIEVTSASHGTYDDVVGAWHELPSGEPITFELALKPLGYVAPGWHARVTFTYGLDRRVSLLAVGE